MMEYVKLKPNTSQYDGQSFNYGTITDAIYVKSDNASDNGNKYIEALPQIPDIDTIENFNFKIPQNFSDRPDKSEIQKLREIIDLYSIRFPMPYDSDLWNSLYLTMVQSYSKRSEIAGRSSATVTVNGEAHENKTRLVASSLSAPVGFNLIGPSGCGKSSALEIAINYYPKVIRHINEDGSMTIQIPCIYVSCPPDSNFKVLFGKIGKEIDRYLGNTFPTVEKEIMGNKNSKIGEISSRLCKVIEQYAVGVIILDEIQQLSFSSTKENSFNTLMTLVNDSMVGLGLAGTEEVIEKIIRKPQFARRVGSRILCDQYTKDKEFLESVFKPLTVFQWGDKYVEFTDEMRNEILMESHGMIAYIVLIYTLTWAFYISENEKASSENSNDSPKNNNGKKREINLNFIKEVIEKFFRMITIAINREDLSEKERDVYTKDAYDSVKNGVIDRVSEVSQERKIKDMAKNPKATAKEIARRGVVAYIQESYDEFSEDQITKVFDDIYRKEKSPRDLKRETLTKLTSKKRSRRRMPNKSNTGKIEDNTLLSIEESVGDANNPI